MKKIYPYILVGLVIWNIIVTLSLVDSNRKLEETQDNLYRTQVVVSATQEVLFEFMNHQGQINSQLGEFVKSLTVYINPYIESPQPQSKVEYHNP
jgi:hypothetical protein